ncbi:MAG: sulfate adenylyltransferase subunit 1, partial [Caldilineaceae bacterium]
MSLANPMLPLHPDQKPLAPSARLLRIATAGSVDDGKSTLVGRLLHDSKAIFDDQLDAIERATRERGHSALDLALLTDGLRAERAQGMTIDVAYRYFATPRRRFIIADTPGHIQYTRNMVTGASTADLAIVLIDVRKGVVTQSRRHGFLATLLQIPHIIVAVNKMDLVDYGQAAFQSVVHDYQIFAASIQVRHLTFVPISALQGDNVVTRSSAMPWYAGPSLLQHLEEVAVDDERAAEDLRLPVQISIRPHQDFRGFAGQLASGRLATGDAVRILPSGLRSHVQRLLAAGEEVSEAVAGDSVVVTLTDEMDVGRGDMVVTPGAEPLRATQFDAILCWLAEEPLDLRTAYILRHTTSQTTAHVSQIDYRINVDTLRHEATPSLAMNDIARVQIETAQPLFVDPYARNRATGALILIDPRTHNTVAAGLVQAAHPSKPVAQAEPTAN